MSVQNDNGRLGILYGDTVNSFHWLVRKLMWMFIRYMDQWLISVLDARGQENYAEKEERFLAVLVFALSATNCPEALQFADERLCGARLRADPSKAHALGDVATVLRVPTICLNRELGRAETYEEAAKRLLRIAVLHPSAAVNRSVRVYGEMLAVAGVIDAEDAMHCIEDAQEDRITIEATAA